MVEVESGTDVAKQENVYVVMEGKTFYSCHVGYTYGDGSIVIWEYVLFWRVRDIKWLRHFHHFTDSTFQRLYKIQIAFGEQ